MSKRNPDTALNEPVVQPGERIRFEKDGSMSCVRKVHVDWSLWPQFAPVRRRTRHPEFPQLVAEDVEVVRLKGGIAEIITTYYGNTQATRDTGGDSSTSVGSTVVSNSETAPSADNDEDGVEITVDVQTVDIDIQNHPNFQAWANYEISVGRSPFDSLGQFTGFKEGSALAGVKSYMSSQTIYRFAWTTTSRQSLSVPEKLDSKHIRIGFTSRLRGGVWRNEETVLRADYINSALYD